MAAITQALILVGGNATRLRKDAVAVPVSKAFMRLDGEPMLYWNLRSLHVAGIRQLLIAGNRVRYLYEADKVISRLVCKFDNVDYFQDEGNGVHGIPHELRYLLHDRFVFDCGHGLSTPEHYKELMRTKKRHSVVFSAYKPHPKNSRQPLALHKGLVTMAAETNGVIAHPIVADSHYASMLLKLKFNVEAVIQHYCARNMLQYVQNSLPPEYDVIEEMVAARKAYHHYIKNIC